MLTIGTGAVLVLIGYLLGSYVLRSAIGGVAIAILLWAILALYAYHKGDSFLIRMSGAKKIRPDAYPRLYNVVEEMRIASGLERTPDIYIIDDPALNSYAVGRDPNRAAIAVTAGLLVDLNRDELQSVIAHEIAHIKNRDVLLMTMSSIMHGIVIILVSRAILLVFGGAAHSRRTSSRSGCGRFLACLPLGLLILFPIKAFIALLVLLSLIPGSQWLIYLTVSRNREYLADASAAIYTRYPQGLASALELKRSYPTTRLITVQFFCST